jgi:hypothetical protein
MCVLGDGISSIHQCALPCLLMLARFCSQLVATYSTFAGLAMLVLHNSAS